MKKKQLYGLIKEQFDFDVVEERIVYRNVNKEGISKKEKNKIPKEKHFTRYQQWKEYIVSKLSGFTEEGLLELSRVFRMLQRETKSNAEYNKNMYLSVPVIMMTLIAEKIVDYYTVDFTVVNFDGVMGMAIFLLLYIASIILLCGLIVWVLIRMNMDFVRVGRNTFFYDDVQEIITEMIQNKCEEKTEEKLAQEAQED